MTRLAMSASSVLVSTTWNAAVLVGCSAGGGFGAARF